jgi:hypothetical protein
MADEQEVRDQAAQLAKRFAASSLPPVEVEPAPTAGDHARAVASALEAHPEAVDAAAATSQALWAASGQRKERS